MKVISIQHFIVSILFFSFIACNNFNKDEIAIVNYSRSGDFGGQDCQVKIYTEENVQKGRLECINDTTLTTILSKEQLSEFKEFVEGLKNVTTGLDCTTYVSCTVTTKDDIISKTNIDCNWRGFIRLKRVLFGVSE